MSFQVKRLRGDDIAVAGLLNGLFAYAFEDPDSYLSAQPRDDYFRRLLERDHVIVLAAMDGQEVVGGLVAYVLEKMEQERSEIYIYDLAVAAQHRRRGVATALIAEVQELAAMLGAWVIYVQADRWDAPAIALYDGLGAREDVLHFDIPPARTRLRR
ncbi:MAG: AAC(3)-I family aminoglycoside N-acetyltransferase [Sphingomonas sp.]|nr:AAC(3)-I family aminoglycoside N-acetyltransferase [Sphingomonas sp.]